MMLFGLFQATPGPARELDLSRSDLIDGLSDRLRRLIDAIVAGQPLPEDPGQIEHEVRRLRQAPRAAAWARD